MANIDRNLFLELKDAEFKRVTYAIYNKLEDEYYVRKIERQYGSKYSIDDFEYYDFPLDKRELFLLKIHGKNIMDIIRSLKKELANFDDVELYVNHTVGYVRVVKPTFLNLFK